MADFHQEGTITTFHDLYRVFDPNEYLINLEDKLEKYASKTKISLLLPCHFTELENRFVFFVALQQKPCQPGGAIQAAYQHAPGHRVQGAGMSHPACFSDALYGCNHTG